MVGKEVGRGGWDVPALLVVLILRLPLCTSPLSSGQLLPVDLIQLSFLGIRLDQFLGLIPSWLVRRPALQGRGCPMQPWAGACSWFVWVQTELYLASNAFKS